MTVITFDAEATTIVPLTPLEDVVLPRITTPRSGPTHLGLALETLAAQVRADVIKGSDATRGDWPPYLFVMTDGKPSDTQLYAEQCAVMRRLGFASIIGCAAGPKAREDDLRPLFDHIVRLDTMESSAYGKHFERYLLDQDRRRCVGGRVAQGAVRRGGRPLCGLRRALHPKRGALFGQIRASHEPDRRAGSASGRAVQDARISAQGGGAGATGLFRIVRRVGVGWQRQLDPDDRAARLPALPGAFRHGGVRLRRYSLRGLGRVVHLSVVRQDRNILNV